MGGLLERFVDPQYVPAVSWAILVTLAVIILYAAYRIVRRLTSGTFISGGRNRRTRLAVMDAAAVDDKRRLVLVRRDDVEHLILIGGPTDVVVEQDIRMIARPARPIAGEAPEAPKEPAVEPAVAAPRPAPAASVLAANRETRPAERPFTQRAAGTAHGSPPPVQAVRPEDHAQRAATPASATQPRPEADRRQAYPAAAEPRRDTPRAGYATTQPNRPAAPASPREPVISSPQPAGMSGGTRPSANVAPPARPSPYASSKSAGDLDDALLQELEESLDVGGTDQKVPPRRSGDDDMAKLLGELSRDRKQ